jgi:uncharacterized membrane protein YhaH (DUF805 family)
MAASDDSGPLRYSTPFAKMWRLRPKESLVQWYLAVLKNYAGFSGRARRTEYWMFALVNFIVTLIFYVLTFATHSGVFLVLLFLYALAVLLPSLAVLVRRLHDIGMSGWWILIGLVPFVGGIVLLVFTLLPGNNGPNRYGDDPRGRPMAAPYPPYPTYQ